MTYVGHTGNWVRSGESDEAEATAASREFVEKHLTIGDVAELLKVGPQAIS